MCILQIYFFQLNECVHTFVVFFVWLVFTLHGKENFFFVRTHSSLKRND